MDPPWYWPRSPCSDATLLNHPHPAERHLSPPAAAVVMFVAVGLLAALAPAIVVVVADAGRRAHTVTEPRGACCRQPPLTGSSAAGAIGMVLNFSTLLLFVLAHEITRSDATRRHGAWSSASSTSSPCYRCSSRLGLVTILGERGTPAGNATHTFVTKHSRHVGHRHRIRCLPRFTWRCAGSGSPPQPAQRLSAGGPSRRGSNRRGPSTLPDLADPPCTSGRVGRPLLIAPRDPECRTAPSPWSRSTYSLHHRRSGCDILAFWGNPSSTMWDIRSSRVELRIDRGRGQSDAGVGHDTRIADPGHTSTVPDAKTGSVTTRPRRRHASEA